MTRKSIVVHVILSGPNSIPVYVRRRSVTDCTIINKIYEFEVALNNVMFTDIFVNIDQLFVTLALLWTYSEAILISHIFIKNSFSNS
jgi:hypothetical protein